MSGHFVYIMGQSFADSWGAPTKIGISGTLKNRMANIQTSCPFKVEIVEVFCCPTKKLAQDIERLAHERLALRRLSGEWFDLEPSEAFRMTCDCVRDLLDSQTQSRDEREAIIARMVDVDFDWVNG